MTKIIFTERLSESMVTKPIAVTLHDENWEFAEGHLMHLREDKPKLMNALLFSGEMGAYLNLLGRLNSKMKELYLQINTDDYLNAEEYRFIEKEDLVKMAKTDAEEATDTCFFYEDGEGEKLFMERLKKSLVSLNSGKSSPEE